MKYENNKFKCEMSEDGSYCVEPKTTDITDEDADIFFNELYRKRKDEK